MKDYLNFIENINNYLRVEGTFNTENYESKILLKDTPSKCLPVIDINTNEIKYDIKNSINLNDWLTKGNKLNREQLEKIIYCLDACLSSLDDRLISENSICLDFNAIRIHEENPFDIYFTIIPNFNLDFSYELSKFLIKILKYVDVEDKGALSLAYGLFVRSSKDNYTINDLLSVLNNKPEYHILEDIEEYEKCEK